MSWRRRLAKIGALFHRRKPVDDLEEEIRAHLAMEEQENLEAGMPADEAHYAALRRFGNVTQAQEKSREMWNWQWLESLLQDIRYGLRQLRRNPGFTAVAVLTLALGIGANTAIFSVLDAVLLKPFPYPGADRMVVIYRSMPKTKHMLYESWPDFLALRTQNQTFGQVVALFRGDAPVSHAGETKTVPVAYVSRSFFSFFGVTPILGRKFTETEAKGGGAPVAVASYSFWQEAFHGDKGVAWKTVAINGRAATIIGVLPPSFQMPFQKRFDLYLPFGTESNDPLGRALKMPANDPFITFARLRYGVSLKRAHTDVNTIMGRLDREYPQYNRNQGAIVIPLVKEVLGRSRTALILLLAATGFVLLLACVNVGHMALARSTTRQREFAVRSSLGASRRRMARQLLLEHLPLALFGGLAGLALAAASVKPLAQLYTGYLFRLDSVRLNWSVTLFAFGACLLAWLLFCLAPAMEVRRNTNLYEALKRGGYGGGGPKGRRLRSALSVTEIALAMVLVVGASLLLRSLANVMDVNPGFNPDNLLAVRVLWLGHVERPEQFATRINAFYSDIRDRISHLPGVRSVGAAMGPPLQAPGRVSPYEPNDHPAPANGQPLMANMNIATPNYFQTLGTRLTAGRFFTEADDASSTPVAVVNQTMARTVAPLGSIIGRWIYVRYLPHPIVQIVGVVKDIKQFNMIRPDIPEVFVPFAQFPFGNMTFMVRTSVNPRVLANTVIRSIHDLDKSQPIPTVTIMSSAVKSALGNQPFVALLMTLFTTLALLLAAVGVSGVTAYIVAGRTHEIGIRAALGARRSQVIWPILWQAMWPALLGIGVGFATAWGLMRFLTPLLYGVKTHDLLTFAIATVVLLGVSLLACYIPARRAAKVDPMVALRYE